MFTQNRLYMGWKTMPLKCSASLEDEQKKTERTNEHNEKL